MSPKTAYLKQISEQRCLEAFSAFSKKYWPLYQENAQDPYLLQRDAWFACWKYLEERLLKEIQS